MSNRLGVKPATVKSLPEAVSIAYTLSEPSKMPWFGYSIPAQFCRIGAALAQMPGTVCSKCYALKGRYLFPNVRKALEKRFQGISHPLWVDAMVFQLQYHHKKSGKRKQYFRWHDSGDIQGVWHLEKIVDVCKQTPKIQHWLPTREEKMVMEYLAKHGSLPDNLIIRISEHMVGKAPSHRRHSLSVSTVGAKDFGVQCEAYTRGGVCGPCRACWTTADINYPLH